jgi:hypothetical protein
MDWTRIESLWVLDLVRSEDMVQYAVEALQEGDESEIVLRLASLARYDLDRAREYFGEWLAEKGCGHMTAWEALTIYAKDVSQQIIEGKLTPYDGGQEILRAEGIYKGLDVLDSDVQKSLEYSIEFMERLWRNPAFGKIIRRARFGIQQEKRRKALETDCEARGK